MEKKEQKNGRNTGHSRDGKIRTGSGKGTKKSPIRNKNKPKKKG